MATLVFDLETQHLARLQIERHGAGQFHLGNVIPAAHFVGEVLGFEVEDEGGHEE